MVRYLFYTIGDLTYQSPLVITRILCPAKGLLLTIISCSAEWPFVAVSSVRALSVFFCAWLKELLLLCPAKGLFFTNSGPRQKVFHG